MNLEEVYVAQWQSLEPRQRKCPLNVGVQVWGIDRSDCYFRDLRLGPRITSA